MSGKRKQTDQPMEKNSKKPQSGPKRGKKNEEEEDDETKVRGTTIKIEDVTMVDKYWHVTRRATRRSNPTYCGLTESVYFQLSEFGLIQDVLGDGNCGVYAALEGLLNCLIPVVTNVIAFRKEVRDFIFNNRNEVLSNFSFAGKILKSGRVRGRRRDDWLEKEVEARMWEEGATFLPQCEEFYYVDANWHFPVMAVMHEVNFVWYDVKEGSTCACVKINVDGLLNEKNDS